MHHTLHEPTTAPISYGMPTLSVHSMDIGMICSFCLSEVVVREAIEQLHYKHYLECLCKYTIIFLYIKVLFQLFFVSTIL
jgi:hypothetical protein